MKYTQMRTSDQRQRGAVLFIALVFLVLIAILSLTATSNSIMQEKMVGAMRNQQLASMGAESALRGGESWLWNLNFDYVVDPVTGEVKGHPLPPCIGVSTGTCIYRPTKDGTLLPAVQKFRTTKAWDNALPGQPDYAHTLTALTGDLKTASIASEPVFLIEDMGPNVPSGAGNQSGAIDPENLTSSRFYRITSRSKGGSEAAIRVMESTFSAANLTDTGINDPTAVTP